MNEIALPLKPMNRIHANPIRPVIWKIGPENVSARLKLWFGIYRRNSLREDRMSLSFFWSRRAIPKGYRIMGSTEKCRL